MISSHKYIHDSNTNDINHLWSRKLFYGLEKKKDKSETVGAQRWIRLQSFRHKLLVAMCGSKELYVERIIRRFKKPTWIVG